MSAFDIQMDLARSQRAAAAAALKAAFSDAGDNVKQQVQGLADSKPVTGLIEKYPYAAAGVAAGAGMLSVLAVKRMVGYCSPTRATLHTEPQRVVIEVKHDETHAPTGPKASSPMDFVRQAVAGYQTVMGVLAPILANLRQKKESPEDVAADAAADASAAAAQTQSAVEAPTPGTINVPI